MPGSGTKVNSNLLEVPSPSGAAQHTGEKRSSVAHASSAAAIGMSRVSMRGGHHLQPDGGWGWVVCLTSLITNGIVFGFINCFGILYVALRDKYAGAGNVSFKTSWVGSVNTGVTFFMCMVASIVSDRVGIRGTGLVGGILAVIGVTASAFVEDLMLLYLTYGFILGLGFAFVYAPSLVILGHYFRKHLGIVNGLVTMGSSVVTISLTFILPELLSAMSIRETFFVLAGVASLLVLCPLTWKPVLPHIEETAHAGMSNMSLEALQSRCTSCLRFTRSFLNVRIWSNRGYLVWASSMGISLFGYFVPFVHLPQYVKDEFPDEDGKFLLMCMAITSGVSRIVVGKLADFKWVNRIRLQQLAFLVLGSCTLCIPWIPKFGGVIALTLMMGICDGCFICLLGPIAFDIVGEKGASQALGFLFGMFSIPMTVGPPVAGFLYDSLGSYKVALHLAGVPPIIGAALMFFIPKAKKNVPAVLSIQEFAAVSCHDIYQSRVEFEVPAPETSKSLSDTCTAAAKMELVTIEDVDELYLLGNKDEEGEGRNGAGDVAMTNGKTVVGAHVDVANNQNGSAITQAGYDGEQVDDRNAVVVTDIDDDVDDSVDDEVGAIEVEEEKKQFLPKAGASENVDV